MDLNKLLEDLFDEKTVQEISKKENADPKQIEAATQTALPALLEQIGINANSKEGRESLAKALDDHADDDVSDIHGFLNGLDLNDSSKMLGHIFGNKQEKVTNNISKQSGLDSNTIMSLMTMLAPLIMGYLGNQKKETKTTSGGLGDLLGNVKKDYQKSSKTDSSIMDKVTDLLGDGGFLGGLFK